MPNVIDLETVTADSNGISSNMSLLNKKYRLLFTRESRCHFIAFSNCPQEKQNRIHVNFKREKAEIYSKSGIFTFFGTLSCMHYCVGGQICLRSEHVGENQWVFCNVKEYQSFISTYYLFRISMINNSSKCPFNRLPRQTDLSFRLTMPISIWLVAKRSTILGK